MTFAGQMISRRDHQGRSQGMRKLWTICSHLIYKPDNNERACKVAEKGQNPVSCNLEEVCTPLEEGSWHVGSV